MADNPVAAPEQTETKEVSPERRAMLERLAKGRATAAANRAKKDEAKKPTLGRPKGTTGIGGNGKNQLAEKARAKVAAVRATIEPEDDARAPLPPPSTDEPSAIEWRRTGLPMLFRHFNLMLKDFGFAPGELGQVGEQARAAKRKAIERLEPMKQTFMALMEKDTHQRQIMSAETGRIAIFDLKTGKAIPDEAPAKGQEWETRKETRSRWGINDTYDVYAARGKRPRPGHMLKLVNDWFYSLVNLIEFKPEIANPPTESKIPEGTVKRIIADHETSKDPAFNPKRANSLAFIQQFLDGAKCEWDGM